jgi:DNA-directed RNA polymerase subunit RPC12/RpoP
MNLKYLSNIEHRDSYPKSGDEKCIDCGANARFIDKDTMLYLCTKCADKAAIKDRDYRSYDIIEWYGY